MKNSNSAAAILDMGSYEWRPKTPTKWTIRLGNTSLDFQKSPLILMVLLGAFLLLIYFKFSGSALKSPQTVNLPNIQTKPGYNNTYPLTQPIITPTGMKYRIAVIADLDTDSKVKDKNLWQSYLKLGTLTWDDSSEAITIDWDKSGPEELTSSLGKKCLIRHLLEANHS